MKKFWRQYENSLGIKKFVKGPRKFQKILKILRETLKKRKKVNFEEIRYTKKHDNFNEI